MVLHTTGYNVPRAVPLRADPARRRQPALASSSGSSPRRGPRRPTGRKLNIWQAATDHHRIVEALKPLYAGKWISTGASKGGMTSIYHRRFYPGDVDGTVAYVAPNDVVNGEDSAYDRFFRRSAPPAVPRGADSACSARRWDRAAPSSSPAYAGARPGQRAARSTQLVGSRRPRVRDHRDRHAVGVLAVPAAGGLRRRCRRRAPRRTSSTAGSTPSRLRLLHRPGPRARTSRTTSRPAPSSAGRSRLQRLRDLRATRACTSRARCPARLPMRVRAPARCSTSTCGCSCAAAGCCSCTARTTRGAPSRSGLGPWTRDSYWYDVPGGNHGANIAGSPRRSS